MSEITINNPSSIWIQLASFSFFVAGLHTDVLIVRICLILAYSFLFISSVLGAPGWPNLYRNDALSVDGLVWALANLYVLVSGVTRLLLDERHVSFAASTDNSNSDNGCCHSKEGIEDDVEALWRLFYRLGGTSRKVFHHTICGHVKVVHFKKGERISVESNFYILYKGLVTMEIFDATTGRLKISGQDGSGSMFDFRCLQMLTPTASDDDQPGKTDTTSTSSSSSSSTTLANNHNLRVTVVDDATVFQISNKDILSIANSPKLKTVWQALFLDNLGRIVSQFETAGKKKYDCDVEMGGTCVSSSSSSGNTNDVTNCFGAASHRRSCCPVVHPLFLPLRLHEEPKFYMAGSGQALRRPLMHLIHSAYQSFRLPWPLGGHPIGLRHNLRTPILFKDSNNNNKKKTVSCCPLCNDLKKEIGSTTTSSSETTCTCASSSDGTDVNALSSFLNTSVRVIVA